MPSFRLESWFGRRSMDSLWPQSYKPGGQCTAAVKYDSNVRSQGHRGGWSWTPRKVAVLIDPVSGWVINTIVSDCTTDTPIQGWLPSDIPYGMPVDNRVVNGQAWKWTSANGFTLATYP